jgi:hypothetical protein
MKKTIIHSVLITIAASGSFTASADTETDKEKQFEHGEKMHAEHCYKCHTDKVYTRDNRFVKSINALSKQVVRCKDNLGIPWFDEDTTAVVHFLNEKYYKF